MVPQKWWREDNLVDSSGKTYSSYEEKKNVTGYLPKTPHGLKA